MLFLFLVNDGRADRLGLITHVTCRLHLVTLSIRDTRHLLELDIKSGGVFEGAQNNGGTCREIKIQAMRSVVDCLVLLHLEPHAVRIVQPTETAEAILVRLEHNKVITLPVSTDFIVLA